MPRRTLILLVVFGLIVLAIYLTGAGLGIREPSTFSCDNSKGFSKSRPVAVEQLQDPGHCIAARTLRVPAGGLCLLTVDSTLSPFRRVILLDVTAGLLLARVAAEGY